MILVDLVLIFPLLIASLFNRRFFGKIVCVLNEKGIYYLYGEQKRVAKWEEIERIEYCIRMWPFFMTNRIWCHARVICGDSVVEIHQVPLMLIQQARKYRRGIKFCFEKTGLVFVALSAAIPLAISLLFGFLLVIG